VTLVAEVEPNLTVAELVKLVPVMVTLVPPEVGPKLGLIPVTDGDGATGVAEASFEAAELPTAFTAFTVK
jgi:hypothetical protein